jgi:hypothetical protein
VSILSLILSPFVCHSYSGALQPWEFLNITTNPEFWFRDNREVVAVRLTAQSLKRVTDLTACSRICIHAQSQHQHTHRNVPYFLFSWRLASAPTPLHSLQSTTTARTPETSAMIPDAFLLLNPCRVPLLNLSRMCEFRAVLSRADSTRAVKGCLADYDTLRRATNTAHLADAASSLSVWLVKCVSL